MRMHLSSLSCTVLCLWWTAYTAHADSTFRFAPVGGLVMASDDQTLIASLPSQGKLVYIDTLTEKHLKEVEVEFQPTVMAVRGKQLFVAAKGAPRIFVLDPDTAKVLNEFTLPGEPFYSMNCHREKGLLYAVNLNNEVFSINPETGAQTKTKGRGQFLAVDPVDGQFVYTGIQKSISDVLEIRDVGGSLLVSLRKSGDRALMLKYKVDGSDLTLVAGNDNAALNGLALAVSADGKQIAVAGGGGWMSKTDQRYHYVIAVFESARLEGLNGQVETGAYPTNVAFHPVLNLGAAAKSKEVIVFNAKSFVKKPCFTDADDSFNHSGYLLFGGKGTKVIHCSYNAPIDKDSILRIASVPLTANEQLLLTKHYAEEK